MGPACDPVEYGVVLNVGEEDDVRVLKEFIYERLWGQAEDDLVDQEEVLFVDSVPVSAVGDVTEDLLFRFVTFFAKVIISYMFIWSNIEIVY